MMRTDCHERFSKRSSLPPAFTVSTLLRRDHVKNEQKAGFFYTFTLGFPGQ